MAAHKAMFFREKDRDGLQIDYWSAVSGGLQLVPDAPARDVLAEDYARMVEDGLLMDEARSFDEMMAACADLEAKARGSVAG